MEDNDRKRPWKDMTAFPCISKFMNIILHVLQRIIGSIALLVSRHNYFDILQNRNTIVWHLAIFLHLIQIIIGSIALFLSRYN